MTAVPATLRLRREVTLRSRAARGDAAAFAAVYERHHQALYRYCRSILRHEEDAQDALQSTMAKAFAALQDEGRDFELKPWLFRIAHNEAISILRRRRETTEIGDVVDHAPMEDRVFEREELRALQLDLADLPERQRAALVLRELNGLSHVEIGAVLDLTPTAVKHSIFEARSALFTCREGREMGCHDVRRMLSDGDGRVLRGRGVRAHLRTCGDCRRFRDDLERRPVALKALAPPLPTAAAASLLAQIMGGGTVAKLLACVALAGGGATLAVEVQHAREAPGAVAAEATSTPAPKRASQALPPRPTAVPVVVSAHREPESAEAPAKQAKPPEGAKPRHAKARHRKPAVAAKPVSTARADEPAKADTRLAKDESKAQQEAAKEQAKAIKQAAKAEKHAAQAEKQAAKAKNSKPPAAKTHEPPGQAKQEGGEPPGPAERKQAKPVENAVNQATGPLEKAAKEQTKPIEKVVKAVPPGQAKQDDE